MPAQKAGLSSPGEEAIETMRKTLIKLAAGAVGGVLGTLFMQKAMQHAGALPEPMRPPMPKEDPGHVIVKQGERVVGPLGQKMHTRAAHGMHWAYGVAWPIGMALVADALDIESTGKLIAAGAVLGAVMWAVGYAGWLPAAGLVEPPTKVPLAKSATGVASHVAYGVIAALPLALTAPRL